MKRMPLEGVRIITIEDFLALPWGTKMLADLGAEVILVQSHKRVGTRLAGAFSGVLDNKLGGKFWNRNGRNFAFSRNKLMLTLDLSKPKGVEILKELVKISDVVTQNFRPGAMKRLGLDYYSLRKVKPDLIYLSSSGYGEEGIWEGYGAFARTIDGMCGLSNLCGYIGGEPQRANPSYIDTTQGWNNAIAVLMALYYRRRTGKGQWIDNSMYEVGVTCIGEALMDYQMNDRIAPRPGNRHSSWAPHGCYKCRGDDKWVTIVARSDKEWEDLCSAMGSPSWTKDKKFAGSLSRWKNQDELDKKIEEWTSNKDQYEVMRLLQGVGVPSGPVLDAKGLLLDPHLKERDFFPRFKGNNDLGESGARPCVNLPFKLSLTPSSIRFHDTLGGHNEYILSKLLGKSADEIAELRKEGIISEEPVIPEGFTPQPIELERLKEVGTIRDYDKNFREILDIK